MILSGLLILSNCTTKPAEKIITQTKYVRQNVPIKQQPRGITMANVEWRIINSGNIDEFVEEFKNDKTLVFIVTTVSGYENLSLNMAELKRYISQQKELIVYYEKSIK